MKPMDDFTRPWIATAADLPHGARLMVHGCEDCACPVSQAYAGESPPASRNQCLPSDALLVRARELVEIPLEEGYFALFNPLSERGVVVANSSAHWTLNQFRQPQTPAAVAVDWRGTPDSFAETTARLIESQIIHHVSHPPELNFQPSQVLTAWLHVTNACNLRCPYCYVNKSAESMDEATGRAAVEAVISSAVAGGFRAVKLKYAGGEASLNYRLALQLHDYAQTLTAQRGLELQAVMLSNGVSFPLSLIEELKAREIRVMISLDGIGADHDVQRPLVNGKPSAHLVERTINQLARSGWPPHISITLTSRNLQGLPALVRFVLEQGLTFTLNFFRDNECAASFRDLQLEEAAIIEALRKTFAVIEEMLPPWSVLGSILDRGQLVQPRLRPCGVGQDYVVISQRGEIAKCHMLIEETLGDVFRSDLLTLIRDSKNGVQNPSVEEKEGCRECTWRFWCSGGCPMATHRATGRYDIKSPNCNIYKAIYPEALRLEGLRILKYASMS